MAKRKNNNGVPSVLAFEKKLVSSDGYMYGTKWDNRHTDQKPLELKEKAVRGTISNRLKGKEQDKLDSKIENPNLQKVDICSLGVDQDTLKLKFTIKFLGGIEKPSSCNEPDFAEKCKEVVGKYIKQHGLLKIASRYAHNLAYARFLWRNRVGAEKVAVHIKVLSSYSDTEKIEKKEWKFNGHEIDMNNFDSSEGNNDITELAESIAKALSDSRYFLLLEVEAYARLGNKQEVYPSEELVLNKEKLKKGSKSKILYSIDNIAGMHSQKIGNAIRTIDTWYPKFNESKIGPIAIEPYGAVTSLGEAYRHPEEECDFYSLFDKWVLGGELSEEDQHYVVAVLIRGGVFGKSDNKESKGEQ